MDPVEYLPLCLMPEDGSRSLVQNFVLHSTLLCVPDIIQMSKVLSLVEVKALLCAHNEIYIIHQSEIETWTVQKSLMLDCEIPLCVSICCNNTSLSGYTEKRDCFPLHC